MLYEEVKKYIKELNILHLKIVDANNKKIIEFIGEYSPENLINKVEGFLPSLQSYGRVTFIAANETQYKQHWKDCCQWPVTFGGIVTTQQGADTGVIPRGFVSQTEASLMAQLQSLQLRFDYERKFAELEKKIDGQKEGKEDKVERMIDKYAPFMLPMMGFQPSPEQMDNMIKMYQMQGLMKHGFNPMQQQGIAGANTGVNTQSGAKIELTEEEKKQLIVFNNEIDKLTEKASLDKLTELTKGLNDNPQMIEMALNFMNNLKNQNNGKTT